MTAEQAQTFRLERVFNAPRHVVFEFFTKPELVKTWWGPDSVKTEYVEIDLISGGICRWEMRDREGSLLILHGQVLEVDPPKKLVMTHQWENNDEVTTVCFTFLEIDGRTKVVLEQTGINASIPIDLYKNWWASAFDCLKQEV